MPDRVFMCMSTACRWNGLLRRVKAICVGPGLYACPDIVCECRFSPRQLQEFIEGKNHQNYMSDGIST